MNNKKERKTIDQLDTLITMCKLDKKDHKKAGYARVTRALLTKGIKMDESTVSRYFRAYECILKGEPIPDSFVRFLNLHLLEKWCNQHGLADGFRNAVVNVPAICELENHQLKMDIENAGNEKVSNTNANDIVLKIGEIAITAIQNLMIIYEGRQRA